MDPPGWLKEGAMGAKRFIGEFRVSRKFSPFTLSVAGVGRLLIG